jgi:hypothetical protein
MIQIKYQFATKPHIKACLTTSSIHFDLIGFKYRQVLVGLQKHSAEKTCRVFFIALVRSLESL